MRFENRNTARAFERLAQRAYLAHELFEDGFREIDLVLVVTRVPLDNLELFDQCFLNVVAENARREADLLDRDA